VEKSDKTNLVNNYLETHPYKLVHKTMYFIQNVIKRGNDVRINNDENLQKNCQSSLMLGHLVNLPIRRLLISPTA